MSEMLTRYNFEIDNSAVIAELQKQTNQIYKLLPLKEEKGDWGKLLNTIILEFVGMDSVLFGMHDYLFPLLCKLESLTVLVQDTDFLLYRKTIFECLSIVGEMIKNVGL